MLLMMNQTVAFLTINHDKKIFEISKKYGISRETEEFVELQELEK